MIRILPLILLLTGHVAALRAATFTVTNSNDSGAGSLRQAVLNANNTAAADTVVFDTAGHFSVPRTITLASHLVVSNPVTIDAPPAANRRVTVSAGGASRVIRDVMQAAGAVTLRNLTLRDGVSTDGGGISLEGTATVLTLENCTVSACSASGRGGAIHGNRVAEVLLLNTTLSLNTAEEGGGLYILDGDVTVTGGFITGNTSTGSPSLSGNGAGLRIESGTLTMTGVQVSLNVANSRGGGVYSESGGVITDCVFSSNRAGHNGGAVFLTDADFRLRNCTFAANRAESSGISSSGGALAVRDPGYGPVTVVAEGCTFQTNFASSHGGGLSCDGNRAHLTAVNCTVSNNSAEYAGGGVYGSGVVELRNCTVTGNQSGGVGGGMVSAGDGTFALGNCIVAGNTAANSGPDYATDTGFNFEGDLIRGRFESLGHNIIGIRSAGDSGIRAGVNGDRVGTAAMPLDPLLGPLATNDGTTQTHALLAGSPAVDAGDAALIVAPPFSGSAFTDQQGRPRIVGSAVDAGAVEQAVLEVTNTADSGLGSLRDVIAQANSAGGGTIGLKRSVFASTRQTITLTSGQIAITSPVVITAPEAGLTISGNNSSRLFNITGGADVRLERVHLVDGTSTAEGGAVRVNGAATKLLFKSGSISGCDAVGGGGLVVEGGTAQITGSYFKGNTATTGGGGAIKVTSNGTLRLTNSTVTLCLSNTGGGGLFQDSGSTTLINTTIAANTADADNNNTGNGGGMLQSGGTVSLGNTVVASNLDLSSGTSHPDCSGAFNTLGHNLIGNLQGGTGLVNGTNGDLAGSSAAPLNARLTAGGGTTWYVPQVTSPAVNAGDNALLDRNAWPEAPSRDQRGQYRIVNSTVDIGAAEGPLEAVVSLEVARDAASERDLSPAKFRLTRSMTEGSLPVSFTVDSASTAVASDYTMGGPSYTPTPKTVVFPDGGESIVTTVTPTQDNLTEGTESVTISLTGSGYAVDSGGTNTQTVSILDDEFLVISSASTGPGSLREAIKQCNDFGGGKITLSGGLNITLRGSALQIGSEIEIIGNVSTISAAGRSRVFEITGDGGGCVKLQGLIIAGGSTTSNGGGIYADRSCVELRGCSLTLNQADGYGGAIYTKGRAPFTIVNSAIYENAALSGGGIAAETELGFTNLTIARNTALNGGGGVLYFGDGETATVTNCTITGNRADTDPNAFLDDGGGGLYCSAGTVLLRNTVVSGNTDATVPGSGFSHHNIRVSGGTFQSGGGNFFSDNNGVTGLSAGSPNAGGDYVGTAAAPLNPRLIAQPDLRPFYAFPPASLLSGRGINANNSEPNDQRGRPRISGGTIDIGAVEMSAIMVTNNGDAGTGTLSKAITDANGAGGGDILLDEVFFNGSRNIAITSGELAVTSPVDIMAPSWPSAAQVQISVSGTGRVMKLAPAAAASITLRQLRLYGGNTTTNAAGDRNGGVLLVGANAAATLLRCELVNGTSPSDGGLVMVAANASLTARDTSMSSGSANRGGIIASSGALNLERCLIRTGNSLLNGGGIFNSGTATLLNCSFQSNSAAGSGGAVFHAGGTSPLTLAHCTLYFNRSNNDNTGSETGGGIRQFSGPVSLRNTLLVENFEGNGPSALRIDLAGAFTSSGFNLITSTGSATGFTNGVNGDQAGTTSSPLPERVGLSADNGGPTITNALRGDSLCLDAGDDTGAPTTDQRGLLRRYGGGVDIGAYELQPETYDFWATHAFPDNAAGTGPGSDYDGDGVLNEIEYATGSEPAGSLSRPFINITLAGAQCHFDYPASVLAPPGYLRLRLSTNLSTWNDAPAAVSQGFDAVTGLEIWRVTVNLAAFPKRFARLER